MSRLQIIILGSLAFVSLLTVNGALGIIGTTLSLVATFFSRLWAVAGSIHVKEPSIVFYINWCAWTLSIAVFFIALALLRSKNMSGLRYFIMLDIIMTASALITKSISLVVQFGNTYALLAAFAQSFGWLLTLFTQIVLLYVAARALDGELGRSQERAL